MIRTTSRQLIRKIFLILILCCIFTQFIIFLCIPADSYQLGIFGGLLNRILNVNESIADENFLLLKLGGFGGQGFGENGHSVRLPAKYSADSEAKYSLNQFDVVVSDLISVNRTLPDVRSSRCLQANFSSRAKLANLNSSIIIVFHNEAWSTLLRTIHSVVNRSPSHLLHEIILVDDASDHAHLKQPLDRYLVIFRGLTKLIRLPKRSGLIRARLIGASNASGLTLTFLDAHCEVTVGWLEPLIANIHDNPRSLVCPAIDVINDHTFEYMESTQFTWGVFDWGLNFDWGRISPREQERLKHDPSSSVRTPAMAGGLFMILRDYFYELGAYDESMEIWGGENVEFSLRVWQCGGELLIAPCSRVGHVFRKISPYSWPGGTSNVLHKNHLRTARVWLDEFIEYSFNFMPSWRVYDFGDVSDRLKIRNKLRCRNFAWYLTHIYPESIFRLNVTNIGPIKNTKENKCFDLNPNSHEKSLVAAACHNSGGSQTFAFTANGEIVGNSGCLESQGRKKPILVTGCSGIGGMQEFRYDKGAHTFVATKLNLCIRFEEQQLYLDECADNIEFLWEVPPPFMNISSHT